MKITYILPAHKPIHCIQNTLNSIEALPPHDYETIVVGTIPFDTNPFKNTKFILDENEMGSTGPINKGYKSSNGDIVAIVVDDHRVPLNFLEVFDYFNSEPVKSKKIQLGNIAGWLGGPGKNVFMKDIQRVTNICPMEAVYPSDFLKAKPYPIIAFPIIARESVEKYLGGVVFNEMFHHRWADNWLGFYAEMLDGDWEIGPKTVTLETNREFDTVKDKQFDDKDKSTFLALVSQFSETLPYNHKF